MLSAGPSRPSPAAQRGTLDGCCIFSVVADEVAALSPFNKKCSSCSLAHSTHLTAAALTAGLLGLHLGPRLLARGFARVQQDQTWGAVPGRQSEGAGQRKRSRLSPPTTTSRPWPESRLGESGRPDELADRRRHFVLAANSSVVLHTCFAIDEKFEYPFWAVFDIFLIDLFIVFIVSLCAVRTTLAYNCFF